MNRLDNLPDDIINMIEDMSNLNIYELIPTIRSYTKLNIIRLAVNAAGINYKLNFIKQFEEKINYHFTFIDKKLDGFYHIAIVSNLEQLLLAHKCYDGNVNYSENDTLCAITALSGVTSFKRCDAQNYVKDLSWDLIRNGLPEAYRTIKYDKPINFNIFDNKIVNVMDLINDIPPEEILSVLQLIEICKSKLKNNKRKLPVKRYFMHDICFKMCKIF
jgi:hypothetical protein